MPPGGRSKESFHLLYPLDVCWVGPCDDDVAEMVEDSVRKKYGEDVDPKHAASKKNDGTEKTTGIDHPPVHHTLMAQVTTTTTTTTTT